MQFRKEAINDLLICDVESVSSIQAERFICESASGEGVVSVKLND